MNPALEQIRDQQQKSWDLFSPGWKKWDVFNMKFLQPMGEAIIDLLNIQANDQVLDIATGTGEPGLSIARIASSGSVTGTDLSEKMLVIAKENAVAQGIGNYDVMAADVCALPFPDDSFDAISCRMGFMFFPDMLMAAREMLRVLKPGGRMAASVWASPQKNPWVTTMMGTISLHIPMPAPLPGAPGMFRCAAPGMLQSILSAAGFHSITEYEVAGSAHYETPEKYWENMTELAAPVVAALNSSDDATKESVRKDVFTSLEKYRDHGKLSISSAALILYGVK